MTITEELDHYRAGFPIRIGNSLIGLSSEGVWWRVNSNGEETLYPRLSSAISAATRED